LKTNYTLSKITSLDSEELDKIVSTEEQVVNLGNA
jgi:hypothetical protein